MNKYLPDKVINKGLASISLLVNNRVEVALGAVFDDNVDLLIINKAIEVTYDIRRVKCNHHFDFLKSFKTDLLRHLRHINNLYYIEAILK